MKGKANLLSLLKASGIVGAGVCVAWLFSGCAKTPSGVTRLPANETASASASSFGGGARTAANPAGLFPGYSPSYDGSLTKNQSQTPISLPSGEELWVLARGTEPGTETSKDDPGSGTLLAKRGNKQVAMPLKHTDVRASIRGYIGAVEVRQEFHNPYSSKIEAVYVFPLPHNAAVNEFIMTIGDRRIRGIIRERKEAEEIYQQAKQQGYVASLLTEERPNIFTQSVANIEPGKEIDISIKYFHTLEYADGWYEFVFPMVVGPRFNPPGSTTGVGAVARGSAGVSGQSTEIQYLAPGEPTGHDISLSVDLDAGVPIEEVQCKTHKVTQESSGEGRLLVSLSPADRLPNRDFVLRYRVAGERIKESLLAQQDAHGGYFTLMLYPPQELKALKRQPLELVFVLDCSGSMSGRPIAAAKKAIARGLRLLQPGDSFQLFNFSMSASQFGPEPVEATDATVERALQYLASLEGEGGTMMIEGIKAALDFPHDPQRLRFVCFLTDGYIGNESEILAAVQQKLGPSRIFSFGIGSAVNRYLLDQMAKTGRGAVAYLGPHDDSARIMQDFFERISHPALTDLKIDWGGLNVSEVYPRNLPDLFPGRPVILTGRFQGNASTTVRVAGNAAGERVVLTVPAELGAANAASSGIASVWARMKIADLAQQSVVAPDPELPEQIKQLALDYSLMSAFTAFVAVDSTRQTEGAHGTTVPVAVPVPEGVNYDTTVQEK